MLAAASRLASEIAMTAAPQGKPGETAHNARAAMKPNHAVTARIAATAPQATIHTSVRPARRVSSANNSRKSEMTRRADANVSDTPSRTQCGDEASLAPATPPCRGSAVLSGLGEPSNPRSE